MWDNKSFKSLFTGSPIAYSWVYPMWYKHHVWNDCPYFALKKLKVQGDTGLAFRSCASGSIRLALTTTVHYPWESLSIRNFVYVYTNAVLTGEWTLRTIASPPDSYFFFFSTSRTCIYFRQQCAHFQEMGMFALRKSWNSPPPHTFVRSLPPSYSGSGVGLGWGLRVCISKELPGNTYASVL